MEPYYTQPFTDSDEDEHKYTNSQQEILKKQYLHICEQLGSYNEGHEMYKHG